MFLYAGEVGTNGGSVMSVIASLVSTFSSLYFLLSLLSTFSTFYFIYFLLSLLSTFSTSYFLPPLQGPYRVTPYGGTLLGD